MDRENPLDVYFYKTQAGNEPVRDWLKGLDKAAKKSIGEDIKTVQYGWPIGMPVVRKFRKIDIWEIRTNLEQGIARVLFTMWNNDIILLHGFVKKSKKTPKDDLKLAGKRLGDIKREG